MAILEYGPLASEVRGSIGGVTFTAGRFGKVCKVRRAPVHSPTPERSVYKSLLLQCDYRWMNTLNQGQRDAWDTLADNTTFTNSLGQEYHPTGLNLYVRTNSLKRKIVQAWIDVAPNNATGETAALEWQYLGGNRIQARLADPPAAAHRIAMWLGLPQNPSRSYFTGPYNVFTPVRTIDIAVWFTIPGFPLLIVDQRYFIRRRGVMDDGAISPPLIEDLGVTT